MNDTLHTTQGLPLSPEQAFALHKQRPPLHVRVCMAGALQPRQLHAALLQVVERHTSLRVALRASNLYRSLRQHVVEPSVEWHVLDAELSETDYPPHFATLAAKPFDLERGCLVRGVLSQRTPNEWRLDLWVAACAGDRLSLQNLYAELVQCHGLAAATLDEAFEYSQYIEWRNDLDADDDAPAARAYWAALGLEALPPIRLGYRSAPMAQAGATQVTQITSSDVNLAIGRLVEQYAQPRGTLLQAAWWVLLARISGQSAFIAGWQQDCRVDYEALANGIGAYEKVLPLALRLDLNAPFQAWLHDLASQLEQHTQHQEHWNVATAATAHHRKVGFNLVSRSPVIRGASVQWSIDSLPGVDADFELALQVSLDEHGNDPHFSLQSPAGHIGEHDLRCLLEQYVCLLTSLAAEQHQGPLLELALSPAAHRQRQLQLSGPRRDFGSRTVIERLADWALQTPDAPALHAGNQTLTYRELHRQVEHLAGVLRARGIGRESKVALLLPRSTDLILGVLAVLRAGAAYVPLDPAWPEARRAKILADAQPHVLIGGDQGVSLAELQDAPASAEAAEPIALDDAAYLLYTSGTSGEPKGVVIEHAQLLNYTAAISEALGLDQCKRFALISSVAADLGNTTLYGALWNGGCLVIASDDAGRDAAAFARYLREQRIDCLKIVPSHLAALLEDQASTLPQVLILGGEPCPAAVRQRIQALAPDCRVHNHYGPTETTVGVLYSHSQAFDAQGPLALERALANTYAQVMEPTASGLRLAPLGGLGEVYLGGAQVSRGYLNRSSPAFIDDPLQPGQRLYRTGDLARLAADGRLHLAGRNDQQIKVRGFRVEPGELEAALLTLEGVSQAVVHVSAGQLMAYAVSTRPGAELLAHLRNLLPDYLTPAHVLCIPALPRLANGKIDYAALPAPDSLTTRQAEQPPRDALEALLADLYKELLERDSVSITDSLFDMGGHSLIVIKLCTRLRNLLQLDVPPATVFDHPSIAALADALRAQESQPGKLLKIAELRRMLAAMPAEERAALQARALAASQPEASRT